MLSQNIQSWSRVLLDRSPRQNWATIRQKVLNNKINRIESFDGAHPCIFVLSTGRTGTQTLSALLSLAANVFVYHEPRPKLYGLSKLSYEHCKHEFELKVLQEAFLTARRDLLDYSLSCGKGYVETSPQATFLASAIREAVPNARFIHLIRDPRYVVRSGVRRRWYGGHSADKTRIGPLANSDAANQWDNYNLFQKNLWLWTETNRWILQFAEDIPSENMLRIHSEDVYSAHQPTVEKLFSFVNASIPSTKKVAHILRKKLNSQYEGAFPKPTDWSLEMNNDLLKIAGETAESLEYDLT